MPRISLRLQRGVTLVELLVSVFVFAIGVLGFSALQTRSLQATADNAQREAVAWMADSLVGRIRANRAGLQDYVNAIDAFNTAGNSCAAVAQPTNCGQNQGAATVAACTAQELAVYDLWDLYCNTGDANVLRSTVSHDAVLGLSIDLSCSAC